MIAEGFSIVNNLEDEYESIEIEAYKRFRKHSLRKVTQMIQREDFIDYWIYIVTKERFSGRS